MNYEIEIPQIEKKFVKETYDKIAPSFSDTRYRAWESTEKFINSLDTGVKVLEVGCGNGKNMILRDDITISGIDISMNLLKICKERGLNVIYGDGCNLPYKDNEFDAVFSIAVIHHMSTKERRERFFMEMLRVLKPGGRIMLEAWSNTAPQYSREKESDELDKMGRFISFTNMHGDKSTHKRFYHFFNREHFENILENEYRGKKVNGEIFHESNNWIFIGNII